MRRPGSGRPPLTTGGLDSLDLTRMLLERGSDPNVRVAWNEIPFEVDLGVTKRPPAISVGRDFLSFVGATPFYLPPSMPTLTSCVCSSNTAPTR